MKCVFLLMIFFLILLSGNAQDNGKIDTISNKKLIQNNQIDYMDNTVIKKQEPIQIANEVQTECYIMKDDKMIYVTKDKRKQMKKDTTLKNGNIIMKNGMVKTKDGVTIQLKNGDCVDMNGNIRPFPKEIIREDNQEMMQQK